MKVKQAMHRGVHWRSPETSVHELSKLMRDQDVGAVPIRKDSQLVGMVTDRDIVCRALADSKDPASLKAHDVMTKEVVYCNAEEDLQDAMQLMEKKKVRRLPVLDSTKQLVGMLSLGDMSHAASREMAGKLASAVADHHK